MTCAAAVLMATMLLQQIPRQRMPRQSPQTTLPGGVVDAVATFDGKFKLADKKYLTIELEDGNSMRMYLTGKTQFIREGKPVKAADFHVDETVTVDAERDARLNLIAVRVEAVPAKAPQRPPQTN